MAPGTFASPRRVSTELTQGSGKAFMLLDLTGDGKSELVYRETDFQYSQLKPVSSINLPNPHILGGCVLSDHNGDGLKDLVCMRERRKVEVGINTGRGFLELAQVATLPLDQWSQEGDDVPNSDRDYPFYMRNKVLTADFDGDGREDLLLLDYNRAHTTVPDSSSLRLDASPMALLLARVNGYALTWIPATAGLGRLFHTGRHYAGTAIGDVDGDGLPGDRLHGQADRHRLPVRPLRRRRDSHHPRPASRACLDRTGRIPGAHPPRRHHRHQRRAQAGHDGEAICRADQLRRSAVVERAGPPQRVHAVPGARIGRLPVRSARAAGGGGTRRRSPRRPPVVHALRLRRRQDRYGRSRIPRLRQDGRDGSGVRDANHAAVRSVGKTSHLPHDVRSARAARRPVRASGSDERAQVHPGWPSHPDQKRPRRALR